MKWDYWLKMYLERYCAAQGLRPATIASYRDSLDRFRLWAQVTRGSTVEPDAIVVKDVLDYVMYLREARANGDCAVNRHVVILRSFFRAMVALAQIEPRQNPTAYLPRMKAPKRKIRDIPTSEEIQKLLNCPRVDTVLGLRDRAILTLLYGTGIRASECAGVKESDVDLADLTVRVVGKGGNQRVVPLNKAVASALNNYRMARGRTELDQPFFRSRKRGGASRSIIYERVRRFARLARLKKRVTPHVLRHTFATHLVRLGEKLIVLKELLGHQQLSSTQIYLHMTGEDLRNAVDRHPVGNLLSTLGGTSSYHPTCSI